MKLIYSVDQISKTFMIESVFQCASTDQLLEFNSIDVENRITKNAIADCFDILKPGL